MKQLPCNYPGCWLFLRAWVTRNWLLRLHTSLRCENSSMYPFIFASSSPLHFYLLLFLLPFFSPYFFFFWLTIDTWNTWWSHEAGYETRRGDCKHDPPTIRNKFIISTILLLFFLFSLFDFFWFLFYYFIDLPFQNQQDSCEMVAKFRAAIRLGIVTRHGKY